MFNGILDFHVVQRRLLLLTIYLFYAAESFRSIVPLPCASKVSTKCLGSVPLGGLIGMVLRSRPVSKRRWSYRSCKMEVQSQQYLDRPVAEEEVGAFWPAEGSSAPLHVKIVRKGDTVERKHMSDYTKSLVFVNDTYRCATKTGMVPLCGTDEWKDRRDDPKMLFTLLDEFRFDRPGYIQLLPPVVEGDEKRLWVTNFGLTIGGSVVGIDVSGRYPVRKCKAPFVWPNAVEHVPAGYFTGIKQASILVADGFLVPGKTKGNVWLLTDPGGENEVAIRLLPPKASWFYHKAVPIIINGHEGILTARARLPMMPFSKPQGELVWIEKPNTLNPMASWNVPWREVVLADGPDVMFEVVDLDPEDSSVEVFAAEFFGRKLTMHSLMWDRAKGCPVVVERQVIDDNLGQAYSVGVAHLLGENSHLIVTTHEYAPDPSLDRSGPFYWIPGTSSRWTYTSSPAPVGSRGIEEDNNTVGGSLFAYRIPGNWRTYRPAEGLTEQRFNQRLPELFRQLDAGQDGFLDPPKVEKALRALGIDVAGEGEVDVPRLLADADWDGSGQLDYQQFRSVMSEVYRSTRRGTNMWAKALRRIEFAMGAGMKNLETAMTALDAQAFEAKLPGVFAQIDTDGSGGVDMEEMRRAMQTMGVTCSDVELAAMFVEADWDGNGLIDYSEFENLMLRVFFGVRSSANVFAAALNRLEVALKHTNPPPFGEDGPPAWARSTLASGFRVKRASINPGAPGFAYAFYPNEAMRDRKLPPHILLAGDCSDAAYVFRPVHAAGAERPAYDLMATLAFEGTVGSIAIGHVSTESSVDDGWAKFFAPVYETDRVYVFKCGAPPTEGVEPSW